MIKKLSRLIAIFILSLPAFLLIQRPLHAAVAFDFKVIPASPVADEMATIEIRTFSFEETKGKGQALELNAFPWKVEAVSPTGKILRIHVVRGSEPNLWMGNIAFLEPGAWKVGLAEEHFGTPSDPRLGATISVLVSDPSASETVQPEISQPEAGLKWGDIPSWLGLLITGGAFAFAAWTYWRAQLERRKEQAAKVSIVFQKVHYSVDADGGQRGECIVRVVNSSSLPVYDCQIDLLAWSWRKDSKKITGRHISSMNPESQSSDIPFEGIPEPPRTDQGQRTTLNPPIRLTFTDNSGRRWQRRPNGRLEEVGERLESEDSAS